MFDQQGKLIAEAGNSTADYVFLKGKLITKIENAAVYYIHTDHLGTPVKMTDTAKQVAWEISTMPFGETLNITASTTNNMRFPGQLFDEETGLNYNYFRDYRPDTGRYVQADPIGLDGGANLFGYGNPIIGIDPLGLAWNTTDFWDYYKNGNGGTIRLQDVGLLGALIDSSEIKKAMNRVNNGYERKMRDALLDKCKSNKPCEKNKNNTATHSFSAKDFDQDYYYTYMPHSPLWALGNGTVFNKGNCNGSMDCNTKKWAGKCDLHFYIRDRFEDPFDIFNLIPGKSEAGTPYRIHADWDKIITLGN